MRHVLTAAVLWLACMLLVLAAPARAQTYFEYSGAIDKTAGRIADKEAPPSGQPPKEKPREGVKKDVRALSQEAGEKVKTFADHADGMLEKLAEPQVKGWVIFGLIVAVGIVSMFYGWTVMQAFMIPFAPVWGLATGGMVAACIIQALYTEREVWFRLLVLSVGIALGVGLYLFSAIRAKPVAAFLVILSPFLILSAFLFAYSSQIGIVVFAVGFLAGFAAMIWVRPLAIVATSMLGSLCFLAAWGLLSYIPKESVAFLTDSYRWMLGTPLILFVAWAVLTFMGTNFQLATGPRGGLED